MASAEGDHRFPSKHESGQDRLRLSRPSLRLIEPICTSSDDLHRLYRSRLLPIHVHSEHPASEGDPGLIHRSDDRSTDPRTHALFRVPVQIVLAHFG
jgi:hypothetical protein